MANCVTLSTSIFLCLSLITNGLIFLPRYYWFPDTTLGEILSLTRILYLEVFILPLLSAGLTSLAFILLILDQNFLAALRDRMSYKIRRNWSKTKLLIIFSSFSSALSILYAGISFYVTIGNLANDFTPENPHSGNSYSTISKNLSPEAIIFIENELQLDTLTLEETWTYELMTVSSIADIDIKKGGLLAIASGMCSFIGFLVYTTGTFCGLADLE